MKVPGVQVSAVNLATMTRQSVYCEVCQDLCNDFMFCFLKRKSVQALVVNLAMFSLTFGENREKIVSANQLKHLTPMC